MIEWGVFWKIVEGPLKLLGGPLYDRSLRHRVRRDIRAGSGRKIGILLARLGDDTPNNAHRATIYEAIRRELGDAVELTTWPEAQTLGDGNEYDIERRAHEKVQKLLQSKNCDLLISGRVKGQDKETTVLSLRFTVAEAAGGEPGSYKLTEMFDLPTTSG